MEATVHAPPSMILASTPRPTPLPCGPLRPTNGLIVFSPGAGSAACRTRVARRRPFTVNHIGPCSGRGHDNLSTWPHQRGRHRTQATRVLMEAHAGGARLSHDAAAPAASLLTHTRRPCACMLHVKHVHSRLQSMVSMLACCKHGKACRRA